MFKIEVYGEYSGAWRCSMFDQFATLDEALATVTKYQREYDRKLWRVNHNGAIVAGYRG